MTAEGDPIARRRRVHGAIAAILLAVLAIAGLHRPLDEALRDLRFTLSERTASGDLALVEIDAESLRALGSWPFSRVHYAEAIENLREAGADIIAFDVDFSAASSPSADERLRAAIDAAPAQIIVPAFLQQSRSGDKVLSETVPPEFLTGDAVIANVNLFPEADGRVRKGLFVVRSASGARASLAAALAARDGSDQFHIDFGIDPDTIPRLSLIDVLQNDFDPELVRGRRVLIGATALELGDELAVPRHGILSGVVVHALAYESIVQNRTLWPVSPLVPFVLAYLLIWRRLRVRPAQLRWRTLAPSGVVAMLAVLTPMAVQAFFPLSLDLGLVLLAEALWIGVLLHEEMLRRDEALIAQREKLLRFQAHHDPETGLSNQRALTLEIKRLGADLEPDHRVCVAAIGIDHFAGIRSAIGIQATNALVASIATRLGELTGTEPARLGSSVLGVALKLKADVDLEVFAEVTLKRLGDSQPVGSLHIDAPLKVGFARAEGVVSAQALIENACAALNDGQRSERAVTAYAPEHKDGPLRRLSLMTDMMSAIRSNGLSLVYQPKQALATGAAIGAEALVRWTHPRWGAISPETFVSAAEETGHIRYLTQWTVEQIARDSDKLARIAPDLSLSFNLSAVLLCNDEAIAEIIAAAETAELPLTAEITETARIGDEAHAARSLLRLREAGLLISIDDYGMGLSSLSYLRLIEASELKLDKSLVGSLPTSERDRVMVQSTIELAHALGMKVVAEGVEDRQVRGLLRMMGCDAIQGFLFAKPMALEKFALTLAKQRAGECARQTG